MATQVAKIFMNGRSQAVRLPKDFRFDCDEVYVREQGNEIILSPAKPSWDDFFEQRSAFGEDYLPDREDIPPQQRDFF